MIYGKIKLFIYLKKNYLFEDNILSNIVLGEDKKDIDKDRLENTLKISNFIKTKDQFCID